jgi:short-subunit dehydrogenase
VDLDGRTALLTGATGGLGQAIAAALAESGATVVLSARKPEALEQLARELPGEGHRIVPADLADDGAAQALVAQAGEVDVLVANAGLPGTGKLDDFSVEEVQRALRVNLESPILMARALFPGMKERGSGHLVFISSLAGKSASPRSSIYNATKFGLRGFAFALRTDLHGTGVGVSVVSPGFIREAGMFAESGAKSPPGLGTATPEAVAAGVVRAVDHNKLEVAVAPRRQRALAHLSLFSPGINHRAMTSGQAARSADELDAGHKKAGDKR